MLTTHVEAWIQGEIKIIDPPIGMSVWGLS
jgi:hypothetical protein